MNSKENAQDSANTDREVDTFWEALDASQRTIEALKKRVRYLESDSQGRSFLQDMLLHSQQEEVRQRELNKLVLENAICGTVVVSENGTILLINKAGFQMLGYEVGDLLNIQASSISWRDHCKYAKVQWVFHKDGNSRLMEMVLSKTTMDEKTVFIVTFNDITDIYEQEKVIKALASFPKENPQPTWRISITGELLFMNAAAERISLQRKEFPSIMDSSLWQKALKKVLVLKRYQAEIQAHKQWFSCLFVYLKDEYITIYGVNDTEKVEASQALKSAYEKMERAVERRTLDLSKSNTQLRAEIVSRHEIEERLRELSYQDSLTTLGNRRYMLDCLKDALALCKENQTGFALFFLDLDDFKIINDNLGHDAGDDLLKQVALRLKATVRQHDVIARMGGDEFAILLRDTIDKEAGTKVAEKIVQNFQLPFQLGHEKHHVHCSIGISFFPKHADTVLELFKRADIALYKAKELRNSYRIYHANHSAELTRTTRLNNDMYAALQKKQFYLLFQPKVALDTGGIIGAEALIRWQHPELGLILPLEFIPIAERNGLILPIGNWTFKKACKTLRQWHKKGFDRLSMAVNLSAIQFLDTLLPEKMKQQMLEYHISPKHFELEITESLAMQHPERSNAMIQAFREMGISIAIDDFGTGHSSLSRLKDLSIQTLKIDQAFLTNLNQGSNSGRLFVTLIANMAKTLHLNLVAEGVETKEQLAFLQHLGCQVGQGYLFSKPVSSKVFIELLKESPYGNMIDHKYLPCHNHDYSIIRGRP